MNQITVGQTRKGRSLTIPPKVRSTHMQVIGASGTGKTKFLENMIRQDILNNQGLCLIDPTGNLFHDLVRWCETKDLFGRKPIHLFDPSSDTWTFGFNPLNFGDVAQQDISFFVDAMVKACAQVWGGEDTNATPLLKRCLRITFHALAEKRLTLLEALDLITAETPLMRRSFTRDIKDPVVHLQWQSFQNMRPKEFTEQFGSTANRLMEFLASERIRRILGQQENVLDFRQTMDQGQVLLVNLSSGRNISEDNASLLGALIVNDLFLKARGRPKGRRPFYLYIDECARFINPDIASILDEARQFGLHLILAHQHLSQLEKSGEAVYGAVMTNARTKVVFGGLSPDDAEEMARNLFMGEFDLEEAKQSLMKPVVVGHETIWLSSHSNGEGESSGSSRSDGSGYSITGTTGRTWRESEDWFFGEEEELSRSMSNAIGSSSSHSASSNSSRSSSTTYGESQSLRPILQTLPTTVFSLEEQQHKAAAKLRNLRQQQAVIKMPDRLSVGITASKVEDGYARPERVERFKQASFEQSPFATPILEVEQELADRRTRLEDEALQAEQAGKRAEPETPDDFLG